MTSLSRRTFHLYLYIAVLVLLGVICAGLALLNMEMTQREAILPISLVEQFETALNEQRYQDAYEMARDDESALGQVLSAGLANLRYGYPRAELAMKEVAKEESERLRFYVAFLSMAGIIAMICRRRFEMSAH